MKRLLLLFSTLFLLYGCTQNNTYVPKENSIYYWKTTFKLNNYERDFLGRYNITKMYVRFFDVGLQDQSDNKSEPVPVATIKFKEKMPKGVEIVPVIYITVDALRNMRQHLTYYSGLIVSRIEAMVNFNRLGKITEVQLDCDWTESTRDLYYKLCKAVRKKLIAKEIILSSTIRLHQLRQLPPPVDKGVLMIYNTGDITKYATENSILDICDVEMYLGKKIKYNLPLDLAYPNFAWGAVFDKNYKFRGIYYDVENFKYKYFIAVGKNRYESKHVYCSTDDRNEQYDFNVWRNDIVRVERAHPSDVLKVKRLADKSIRRAHNSVIYQLDSTFLSKFGDEEIRTIYNID